MTAPLTSLECELLEAVAHERDDDATSVLGDYWIAHVDEARGSFVQIDTGDNRERIELAEEEARLSHHAARWRAAALAVGFSERDLAIAGGFVEHPLCVEEGSALDEHPDLVRLSPRYYRVGRQLRRGVECAVHDAEAVTPRTRTRVAIKEAVIDDFHDVVEHEYQVLRRVAHPNVVRCAGWATRPSRRALVLQWCGADLRRLLVAASEHGVLLGIDVAASIGVQLFDALAAIHRARIIHREIRSDHVAVTADGTVRVIDFGTSRCLGGGSRFDRHRRYISPGFHDEEFRFRYMAPEQARGHALTESCDVYSATGLVCELVTNQHYAHGESGFAVLQQIVHGNPAAPATLPPRLRFVLSLGFEREPARRPTAAAMGDALVRGAAMDGVEIGAHVIARRLVELGVPC